MLNPPKSTVIAVMNLKGGVGKTTTAVHLAVGLAQDYKVLLIDLDLQASASLYLGLNRYELRPSVAEWLYQEVPFMQSRRLTAFQNLHLVPASGYLRQFEMIISKRARYTYRLKQALEPLFPFYDYIILDCPPAFSLVSVNALGASHYFVAPCPPQFLAFEATRDLFIAVQEAESYYQMPVATPLGVLSTMVEKRTKVAKEMKTIMQAEFGKLLMETEIDYSVKLAQSAKRKLSIYEMAFKSTVALQYRAFSIEVLKRINDIELEQSAGKTAIENQPNYKPVSILNIDGTNVPLQLPSEVDLPMAKINGQFRTLEEIRSLIEFPDEVPTKGIKGWYNRFLRKLNIR